MTPEEMNTLKDEWNNPTEDTFDGYHAEDIVELAARDINKLVDEITRLEAVNKKREAQNTIAAGLAERWFEAFAEADGELARYRKAHRKTCGAVKKIVAAGIGSFLRTFRYAQLKDAEDE